MATFVIQDVANQDDAFTWTRIGSNFIFTDRSANP